MNKTKSIAFFTAILAVAVIVSLVSFAAVSAQQGQGESQGQEESNQNQNQEQNQGEETQNQEQNQEQEQEQNLISTACQNQCGNGICEEVVCQAVGCPCSENQNICNKDCKAKDNSGNGQTNAQEHRSAVANFVQALLNAADRQPGGIGEQVRLIAQAQNESASATIRAMEKVQTRNKIQTFLFGSDYKNLGALRSEIVTTQNRINQLTNILPTINNASDTTEIQSQIQTLEQEQVKINNFIKAQEGQFSLFGWLVKMFNK